MSNENAEYQELLTEFEHVCTQLDMVLKDLEWRKPDVEAEETKLRELLEQAKNDPMTDVATQASVVRVLRAVLNDKLAEADRLEKCMLGLRDKLEKLVVPEAAPGEVGVSGEAVREEEKRLG